MITKISVGDNVIVKYNSYKVCQILKIKEFNTDYNYVQDVETITMVDAATFRYHVDVLILCNAETGTKLNRKQSYNASACECLSEYLDAKRALITKLEKLMT